MTAIAATSRGLFERVFPRGAIVLSVLSLAYFAMGIVRNRVFANTYGAGAELDAYNAAFRIPEIALDVLVAAGLAAPFVPIYSSLRHDRGDDEPANDFGRTVLTGAIVVMARRQRADLRRRAVAGRRRRPRRSTRRPGSCTSSCSGSTASPRSCSRPRSPLGEILVAHRRFVFYALAPILYTAGIILGTVLFASRFGIVATAWGAVAGAAAHLAIRAVGTRRTSFRIRLAFAVRTAAFREFVRLMVPRMFSVADRAADLHVLHARRRPASGSARLVAQLRARLPGPAGQPDRGVVLAGRLPGPVGRLRRRRRRGRSGRSSAATW